MGLFSKNKDEPDDGTPSLIKARVDEEPYQGSEANLEALARGRETKITNDTRSRPQKQSAFLMNIRATGNVSRSCAADDISRKTAYRWKANDEGANDGEGDGFSERWEEAVNAYTDELETEVDRRAFTGDDVPVIYQGEMRYDVDPKTQERTLVTIKKYSDMLALARLKALRPDKYRERAETHHTGGTENVTRVTFVMPDNGRD